jgi:hypothetical protein
MTKRCSADRLVRFRCYALGGIFALAACASLFAQSARYTKDLKFDVVHLGSRTVKGLLVKETEKSVFLQLVYVNPGEPVRIPQPPSEYPRTEIVRIDRLDAGERARLVQFVARKQADRERFKQLARSLQLQPSPWGNAKDGALSYRSKYFLLISDAREDIVRRAAVRLEQVYAAYEDFLPPRKPALRSTTILLVRSLAEYRELLKAQHREMLNLAFYDSGRNEIICACDLDQLGEELEQTRQEHARLHARLAALRRELIRQFKEVPKARRAELAAAEQTIRLANAENNKKFEAATARLFRILYHEAFHAYLANFVYPPAECEVPRWLNEGLAQMFETARLDGGELFADKPDPERLRRAHTALQRAELMPLVDLLHAGPERFRISHARDQEVADRYYLASWALAYYLATERQKLGTPEMDRYVADLKKPGAANLAAFEGLVGERLPAFEKSYRSYLGRLQSSSAGPPTGGTP